MLVLSVHSLQFFSAKNQRHLLLTKFFIEGPLEKRDYSFLWIHRKEKEKVIAEHETLKLWPLLLKRQMMIMPVLPKTASLSPSISDTTIQHLLDWEKSNDNEMLWARDWWSPCREAGILHGAVTWWNAGCPVWPPQSFQPGRWLGHCYPRLLLELNLRAGKEAGSALGSHLLLARAPNTKVLYKRRNNNPFSHMLTLEGWRSTALHCGKKLGAASAQEGGFFTTKCFTVTWFNAQMGWMTELPIERCYKISQGWVWRLLIRGEGSQRRGKNVQAKEYRFHITQ